MSKSLWDSEFPGLDHATFAAAANYLQCADEQQFVPGNRSHALADPFNINLEWNNDSDGEGLSKYEYSEKDMVEDKQELSHRLEGVYDRLLTQRFLGRLAQVFASQKRLNEKKSSMLNLSLENSKRLPPADVTATALVKRPPQGENGGEIQIFIAKNKGLDDKDVKFGSSLVAWLNSLSGASSADTTPKKPGSDATWAEIIERSIPRIRFYVAGIREKQDQWDENKKKALTTLTSNNEPDLDKIRAVFEQIGELIRRCESFSQAPDCRTEFIRAAEILPFAHDIWSNNVFECFPSYFGEMKEIQDYFSKVAKDINFLGRLVAARETFKSYAARYRQYHFTFHEIKPPKEFKSISRETIMEKITSYHKDMPKKEYALNRLRKNRTTPLDFAIHCEMQLLLHFDDFPQGKVFPYFGGSKLSCWMCNEMLDSDSRFSVKGTHGRRVGLWAFDSPNPSPRMLFALKGLQDKLSNKLLEERLRINLDIDLKDIAERLRGMQVSQGTNQRVDALNNAKKWLERAEKGLEKPELKKCSMSTSDVSGSIGENSARYRAPGGTTKGTLLDTLVRKQLMDGVWILRVPKNGKEIERVKVAIGKSPECFGQRPLPHLSLRFGSRLELYVPNLSAHSRGVRLADWIFFYVSDLPGINLTNVWIFFTSKDHGASNGYIQELAADPTLNVTMNDILIPKGDVFIMKARQQDSGFWDMPPVDGVSWNECFRHWLETDRFRKGLEQYKTEQEAYVRHIRDALGEVTSWR
jgi:OTT_1508-like deaminase